MWRIREQYLKATTVHYIRYHNMSMLSVGYKVLVPSKASNDKLEGFHLKLIECMRFYT